MEAATEVRQARALSACLAGVQAGIIGTCWMLLWLGITAKWQQRSFWTPENLIASVFYGGGSIRSGFAWSTVVGLALYLLIYSLVGALFALALNRRVTRRQAVLGGMLFAVAWYFVSFRLLWKSVMPLVALLHTERPTVIGHLLFGAIMGRFPVYLNRLEAPPEEDTPESPTPQSPGQPVEPAPETQQTNESS